MGESSQKFIIPKGVTETLKTLEKANFQAFLVGGCVRDLMLHVKPKDWDITTNAKPEQIAGLFPKTFYENNYGTVTVVDEGAEDETEKHIEITPFRLEAKYSDKRHPDSVTFSDKIEDDLGRRDFTINAMAYLPRHGVGSDKGQIIDPYGGVKDLKDKTILAVGNASDRFEEDPLRIMRGIRLATQLGFTLNSETFTAMVATAPLLKKIAVERINDEFSKLIMSKNLMIGVVLLQKAGALKEFLPELEEGIGMKQNGDHIYDVWEHTLRVAQHSADKDFAFHVRLSALFHDIGKPRTREFSKEKNDYTFYGHDVIGAQMAKNILKRLKFSHETTDLVTKLVRNHMFFSDVDKITLSAVRRIVRNVGREEVWDLMKVRNCDRIGMGRPKESPYRLRKYEAMIDEALRAPTSVAMLKIKGEDVIRETGLAPGPKIGYVLHALLEEALENPELNNVEYLINKAKELSKLDDAKLKELGESGKEKKEAVEGEAIKKIHEKHWVK